MSSLVPIRKSFLFNPSLFQCFLSILFSIFRCLCILRNLAVFDFITCVSFCKEISCHSLFPAAIIIVCIKCPAYYVCFSHSFFFKTCSYFVKKLLGSYNKQEKEIDVKIRFNLKIVLVLTCLI